MSSFFFAQAPCPSWGVAVTEGNKILEGLAPAVKWSRLQVALPLLFLTPWPEFAARPPSTTCLEDVREDSAGKTEHRHFWRTGLGASTVSNTVLLLQWKHLAPSAWVTLTFLVPGCHCWLRRTAGFWEGRQECLGVQQAEHKALFSSFMAIWATGPSAK